MGISYQPDVNKIMKQCLICGKELKNKPNESSKYFITKKYCSYHCMGIANKGKPAWNKGRKGHIAWNKGLKGFNKGHKGYWVGKKQSQEMIDKRMAGNKIKFATLEYKEKRRKICKELGLRPPSNKGKHHSEETKRKISQANRKEIHKTDESKIWRNRIEFRLWREAVFARDNWICQKCEIHNDKLRPHHIINFSEVIELRFAIDNGITLCDICHKLFHHIYGNKHNTKEQIYEFVNP